MLRITIHDTVFTELMEKVFQIILTKKRFEDADVKELNKILLKQPILGLRENNLTEGKNSKELTIMLKDLSKKIIQTFKIIQLKYGKNFVDKNYKEINK